MMWLAITALALVVLAYGALVMAALALLPPDDDDPTEGP